MLRAEVIQKLDEALEVDVASDLFIKLWALGRVGDLSTPTSDAESAERERKRRTQRRRGHFPGAKRLAVPPYGGRPSELGMDRANAALLEQFPVIAENPLLLAMLEHLFELDLDELPTSRFPGPEVYLGHVENGAFVPDADVSVVERATAKSAVAAQVKNVRARARARVRRAQKLVDAKR